MMLFRGLLWIFLFGSACFTFAQDDPVVETDLGKVKGTIMKSAKGREFSAFRGIRYAQAPVGEYRFKPPVAVKAWGDSVLDATKDAYICPQALFPQSLMSEDCLFLSVYSGDLKGNLSVLVYIHGGGNLFGSSHSALEVGPQFLMDHNIVLVAMNYRLGALGFLTTATKEAPGNYGYLDQIMALQWVHDHISRFGGNPNSVTILGFSAGAMAVTLHMASPLSAGLFHRAIAMSGSMTSHFEIDNVALTRELARHLSCPMYNPDDVLECLRVESWQKITSILNSWEPYGVPKPLWFHQVDGHFLLDTPTNVFADGAFNKVPILTGITRDEFSYVAYELEPKVLKDVDVNFDKYAPEFFTYEFESEASAKEKSDRLRRFYLKDSSIDQQLSNLGNIFADAGIGHGVYRLMQLARKHVDVYYYCDEYEGRYGLHPNLKLISHGDDIQYLFNSSYFNGHLVVGDPDWFMVERMTEWWTSFVRDGAPTEIDGLKWLPSNSSTVFAMHNGKDVTFEVGTTFNFDRYSEWDAMFPLRSSADQVKIAWMLTAGAVALHVCAKNVL